MSYFASSVIHSLEFYGHPENELTRDEKIALVNLINQLKTEYSWNIRTGSTIDSYDICMLLPHLLDDLMEMDPSHFHVHNEFFYPLNMTTGIIFVPLKLIKQLLTGKLPDETWQRHPWIQMNPRAQIRA